MTRPAIARLGLGTVALGRSAGLKYARPVRVPSDDEAAALLRAAQEEGVTLIDTAPAYGFAEERLGVLLPRIAPRSAWIISTKAGEEFDSASGASRYDFAPAALRASVERSLRRLATDRLDVVLLHFSSAVDDAAVLKCGDAMAELRALKKEGKAGRVGASIGTLAGAEAAIASGSCDVLMMTLNLGERAFEPWIARAASGGIEVFIKKPLASGHADAASSLRMVLGTPGVAAAIVGTTSVVHLRQAAAQVRSCATRSS